MLSNILFFNWIPKRLTLIDILRSLIAEIK